MKSTENALAAQGRTHKSAFERARVEVPGDYLPRASSHTSGAPNWECTHVTAAALRVAHMGLSVFPLHGTGVDGSCTCGKAKCAKGKHPVTAGWQEAATTDEDEVRKLFDDKPWANIGVAMGTQISEKYCVIAIDCDGEEGIKSLAKLEHMHSMIPKTYKVSTARGYHLYLKVPTDITVRNSADERLGAGIHVRGKGGYVVGAGSRHAAGVDYVSVGVNEVAEAPDWLLGLLSESEPKPSAIVGDVIPEGMRNSTLTSLAGLLRRNGLGERGIAEAIGAVSEAVCVDALDADEVERIAKSISKYPPAPTARGAWPAPLSIEAFHGLAGEIVRVIEPHSEADPVALLLQTLTAAGNAFGRRAHMVAEGDEHPAGLFVCLVGDTAKGRKGTSWGRIRQLFRQAASGWLEGCVTTGAISGEGMVWEVRDPIVTRRRARKSEGEQTDTDGYVEEVTDPGVADKRRLWLASEFVSILKPAKRDTNTLSNVIRDAWDRPNWRTAAKNSPAKVTGAHTSIVAHITAHELRSCLSATESFNGFANRFVFACVTRSKFLAEPSEPPAGVLESLAGRLAAAIDFAHVTDVVQRDDDARSLWAEGYQQLSAGRPGLLGAVTSRAEAQVLRLSLTYALLDGSPVVRRPHLEAALAVWDYCACSAAFLFGDALGSPLADKLLSMLLTAGRDGLSRTEIRGKVGGRITDAELESAFGLLRDLGLARPDCEPTRGRPVERWYAVERTEQSDARR